MRNKIYKSVLFAVMILAMSTLFACKDNGEVIVTEVVDNEEIIITEVTDQEEVKTEDTVTEDAITEDAVTKDTVTEEAATDNETVVSEKAEEKIITEEKVEVEEPKKEEENTTKYEGEPVFKSSEIPEDVVTYITGKSYKENNDITLADLRYLELTYVDFDGNNQLGYMIVHEKVADEVLEIFRELFENEYPFDSIRLVSDFDASDSKSMESNNTSAFNYRKVAGMDLLSYHGYGLAIDINPVQNPWVKNGRYDPSGSKDYVDRSEVRQGMVMKDDLCYKLFISKGWIWGGDWNSLKDYQHFEKRIIKR